MSAFMIPAVPMMTASAERVGVTVVVATSLVNLAYAVGETIGAPTAALLSTASSDAVPYLGLAGLMLVSLVLVRRSRRTARPASGPSVPPASPTSPAAAAAHSPAPSPRNGAPAAGAAPVAGREQATPIPWATGNHACSFPVAELADSR